MSCYPKFEFDAQKFLNELDFRFLICKGCARAKVNEKHYGGEYGECGDFNNQGDELLPVDYICPLHDVYEKIEQAAFGLQYILEAINPHDKRIGADEMRRRLN